MTRSAGRLLTILACLAPLFVPQTARAESIRVMVGGRSEVAGTVGSIVERGIVYADVADLARSLSLVTEWDSRTRTLLVIAGAKEAEFVGGYARVVVGDSTVRLARPALLRGGALLAPAEALPGVFRILLSSRVLWDGHAHVFRVPGGISGSVAEPADKASEDGRERWVISTIVVDPGHGGRDPGTISVDGTLEKDITLAISRRLMDRLRDDLGVTVVATRTADESVSLRERGRIAVRESGRLFVSIHCNAIDKPHISGVQTYFLSDAETDEARAVARAENAALMYEEPGDTPADSTSRAVDEILAGMVSDRFLRESQELAALVQRELVRSTRARDMGVHQAGFYVMKGTLAAMPSILIEVGYVTHAAEAAKLTEPRYQAQLADAVFRAVREFKTRYERGLAR